MDSKQTEHEEILVKLSIFTATILILNFTEYIHVYLTWRCNTRYNTYFTISSHIWMEPM